MSTLPSSRLVGATPADIGVRIAARAVDVVLLVGMDVALGSAIGFGWDFLVIGSLLVLAYFALADALVGATVGKAVFGLRVVAADGGRPTVAQGLRREAFTLIGSIPLAGPILALGTWIWISLRVRRSDTRQGPHDEFAGGTRVVRRR